jgi:hypothetical protein
MTDWKLTNAELKKVANCELDTLHPGLACDRTPDGLIDCQHCPVGHYCGFIVREGQRKLLEYILENPMEFSSSDMSRHNAIQMLKELEASQ